MMRCYKCRREYKGRAKPLWVWFDGQWLSYHTTCRPLTAHYTFNGYEPEPPQIVGRLVERLREYWRHQEPSELEKFSNWLLVPVLEAKATTYEEAEQAIQEDWHLDWWINGSKILAPHLQDEVLEGARSALREVYPG